MPSACSLYKASIRLLIELHAQGAPPSARRQVLSRLGIRAHYSDTEYGARDEPLDEPPEACAWKYLDPAHREKNVVTAPTILTEFNYPHCAADAPAAEAPPARSTALPIALPIPEPP